MSLEAIIEQMKGKRPLQKKGPKPDKPYYTYTGQTDTRETDGWKNNEPAGTLKIVHQDIEMSCQITNDPSMPGFQITCKDNNGRERKLDIFLNPYCNKLTVCTTNKTDVHLDPESRIRQGYAVPFVDEL